MNCKNCLAIIPDQADFCSNCGAKVIKERITLRKLMHNFFDEFFGWDNKYLLTTFYLITQPQLVLGDYLNGVRKKYVSPFAYIAIGAAMATLIYNLFIDEYLEITRVYNYTEQQIFEADSSISEADKLSQLDESIQTNMMVQTFVIKYFNFLTFLFIPFYALISFIVYRKPYNFGEHLIIACYVQGFLFLTNIILFLLSLVISPYFFSFNVILAIVYYLYAYGKLYGLNVGQSLSKLMIFLGVMVVVSVAFFLLAIGIAAFYGAFIK
tara:strand:- start:799 stop:1599 length:801 start_codon:yes stop_codon:yes gene_type:complete